MSYIVIDDAAPSHPKLLQAGGDASWLWFCGLCYCHRHKTDGFIPLSALSAVTHSHNRRRSAATLSRLGLWRETTEGWHVHDYLEYQQSKATINKQQKDFRDWRSAAGKKGAAKSAGAKAMAKALASTVQIIPDQKNTESATMPKTTATGNGHPRSHVFCGRRFCVPSFLHQQFDQQLAGRGPDFDLLGWYQELDARNDQPVADLFGFLRDAFKAAVNDLGKRPAVDWDAFLDDCRHTPKCDTAWRCNQLREMAAINEQEAV